MNHVLLAISPRWAEMILCAEKRSEVRRGRRRWAPGDWLWLYAATPVRAVVGVALVADVHVGEAVSLVRRVPPSALTWREYWRYARTPTDLMTIADLISPARLGTPLALAGIGVGQAPRSAVRLESRSVGVLLNDPVIRGEWTRLASTSVESQHGRRRGVAA